MIKFLFVEWINYIKNNLKYFLIFVILEFLIISSYSIISSNGSLLNFALSSYKDDSFLIIYFVNKIFVILFMIYISILNVRYFYGFATSYLISRSTNYKIILISILSIILNIIFINLILFVCGCFVSLINNIPIEVDNEIYIYMFFLEITISLLTNFYFYPKYRFFLLIILILIPLFLMTIKSNIYLLSVILITILFPYLLKIQDL